MLEFFNSERLANIIIGAAIFPMLWIPYHRSRQYFISRGLPTNWRPGAVKQLRQKGWWNAS